jgi:hypothetical protein
MTIGVVCVGRFNRNLQAKVNYDPLSTSVIDSRPSATSAKEFPTKPAEHLAKPNPRFTEMPRTMDFVPPSALPWELPSRFMGGSQQDAGHLDHV